MLSINSKLDGVHDQAEIKFMVKSHNFFDNSVSVAFAVGVAKLLSLKYFPVIPSTCGFSAT